MIYLTTFVGPNLSRKKINFFRGKKPYWLLLVLGFTLFGFLDDFGCIRPIESAPSDDPGDLEKIQTVLGGKLLDGENTYLFMSRMCDAGNLKACDWLLGILYEISIECNRGTNDSACNLLLSMHPDVWSGKGHDCGLTYNVLAQLLSDPEFYFQNEFLGYQIIGRLTHPENWNYIADEGKKLLEDLAVAVRGHYKSFYSASIPMVNPYTGISEDFKKDFTILENHGFHVYGRPVNRNNIHEGWYILPYYEERYWHYYLGENGLVPDTRPEIVQINDLITELRHALAVGDVTATEKLIEIIYSIIDIPAE